jgi:SAM-dependent methyltransferase
MFLNRRTTQAEYFDSLRPFQELADFFQCLDRLNRFFVFAEPFQRFLPRMLGTEACSRLSILDLGAGDGQLGRTLTEWARRRGWDWNVINLDQSLDALKLSCGRSNVAGSALALPFQDDAFDVVIASQMTHHLAGSEIGRHFAEAYRVTRRAMLVSDLHRNRVLYVSLWLVLRAKLFPRTFREDALLSVKRGFRVHELQAEARAAGIRHADARLYFGARILLLAAKRPNPALGPTT